MGLRLKQHGDEQYLHKNIKGTKLFDNSFIENSVQFSIVQNALKEGKVSVDGAAFSYKITPARKNFEILVSSDCPVVKLHFSLEGGYNFESLNADEYSIHIPECHCNIFYLPCQEGKDVFLNENSKIFEIYVSFDYLQRLLCPEFKELCAKMNRAKTDLKPCTLWKKSRLISPQIMSKIKEIEQCPHTGQVRKSYLEGKLTVLLIDFLLGEQTSKALNSNIKIPKADYLALVKVEAYIRKNLRKPLNILDLAEVAGFNATKLKRDFKRVYGITIFKHITALRMEEAKKMILQDGASIAHAAYEVGYANPQHFTAAFKRSMGYLPSHLKQTM